MQVLAEIKNDTIQRDSDQRQAVLSEMIIKALGENKLDLTVFNLLLKNKIESIGATPEEVKEVIEGFKNEYQAHDKEKLILAEIEKGELLRRLDKEEILKDRKNLKDALSMELLSGKIESKALAEFGKFLTFGYRQTDADLAKQIIKNYKENKNLTEGIISGKMFWGMKKDKTPKSRL